MNIKTMQNKAVEFSVRSSIMQELRDIKKGQKKPDGLFGSFMTRPVSHVAAYASKRLHFTPNMVTFLSFVSCGFSCLMLLMFNKNIAVFATAAVFWWVGAILDAADGDLARYTNKGSAFGGWFDSFLDRIKEFIIFGTLGYLAFKGYGLTKWGSVFETDFGSEFYLFLGFVSIFSNVMSGWITDTKKIFCNGERKVEMKLSNRYCFGMVDTRDFFVILSLFTGEFRIALYIYGFFFPVVIAMQTGLFLKRYGSADK